MSLQVTCFCPLLIKGHYNTSRLSMSTPQIKVPDKAHPQQPLLLTKNKNMKIKQKLILTKEGTHQRFSETDVNTDEGQRTNKNRCCNLL